MKDLPQGTKVRVLCNKTDHGFNNNQIVIREYGEHDNAHPYYPVAFVSECGEEKWYMVPEEYEVVSHPDGSNENRIKELEEKVKELEKIIESYRSFAVNVLRTD